MRQKSKLLLCGAAILVIVSLFVFMPKKPTYFRLGNNNYKVLRWEVQRGSNVTFATDYQFRYLGRRLLDRAGAHLPGPRQDSTWNRTTNGGVLLSTHVLKLLCQGLEPSMTEVNRQVFSGVEGERLMYLDQNGNELAPYGPRIVPGPPGQFWFYWVYDTTAQPTFISQVDPRSGTTNFIPRQFRIIRRSDRTELLRLQLAE